MRLKGKTALVTGGNRGIGLEVCRQLGQEGAFILLGSRDQTKGDVAAADLRQDGVEVAVEKIDLSDRESILHFLAGLKQPVDIVINNAAVLDRGDMMALDDQQFHYVLRTNLVGPVILTTPLSKMMQDRNWGRIVNVTSGMGSLSRGFGADSVAYRISKLALNGFTISLAEALRGSGVLVNAVDPGWVRTQMGGPMAHKTPQEGAKGIVWAVLLPDRGPTGCFFRDSKKLDW